MIFFTQGIVSDGWSRWFLRSDCLGGLVARWNNKTEAASCASTNNVWWQLAHKVEDLVN